MSDAHGWTLTLHDADAFRGAWLAWLALVDLGLTVTDGTTLAGEGAELLGRVLLEVGPYLADGERERAELLLRTLEATPATIPAPPMPAGETAGEGEGGC